MPPPSSSAVNSSLPLGSQSRQFDGNRDGNAGSNALPPTHAEVRLSRIH
jgi:hypothetical protein